MKASFRKSFSRDLKKLKDQAIRDRVREIIEQVEAAADPGAIGDLKKLSGAVDFVRCLPRRDLSRFFP